MGNYRARRAGFLQAWQINVAEYTFQGYDDNAIAKFLWDIDGSDKRKLENAKQRLRRLRQNEKWQEYYRSILTEWSVHNVGKAFRKLSEQIDSNQPWLANKAANDVITLSKPVIQGNESNEIVVKVEGMPELGVPDEE